MTEKEPNPLELYLNRRIKEISKTNERSEDENEELQFCYWAKSTLEQEKASRMTSIETLESVKNKLTPDEYNTIANDLTLLARIWYAVSSEDDDYFYIEKARDDGSIAKYFKGENS